MSEIDERLLVPLAALSGILYFLAFPGMDLWPLAFVAQAPLILALRGQAPGRAAMLGLVSGFTSSAAICAWLFGTIQRFGGFSAGPSMAIMVLLCLWTGGRTALLGWLHGRATPRGWPAAPVFVLAFVASEITYPFLFPWYFGVTVHNAIALLQVAELGGPFLVGAMLLAPNLAVAELVAARLERRGPSRRLLLAGLAIPALAAGYGAIRIHQVDARAAAAPPIRIGLAQANQPLVGRHEAVKTNTRLTHALRDAGAELVIWSESTLPDTFPESTYRDQIRRDITADLGVATIIGTSVKREEGAREFNTALLADTNGAILGRYDKRFLLPFGEYIPFGDTFPSLYAYSQNSGRVSPGESTEPLVLRGHPITALICYEDILPGFVNAIVAHAQPELLVNLTIDTWFGRTSEPWQHVGLAAMRAVEHRRYLARATNSGVSAIIDPSGRVIVHGGVFEEEAIVGEARWMRSTTVYEILGDAPLYACAVAIAVMALVERRRFARPA